MTSKDLARLAGVLRATVSRALNGKTGMPTHYTRCQIIDRSSVKKR